MKELLFALLLGGLGALLLFAGYRFARVMLTFWGLIGGFMAGSAIFTDFSGDTFLATTAGIVTGVLVGLLFGALAYFYYGFAVVLLCAGLGYAIGSGFITMLGIDPGFLSTTVGVAAGALFGLMAVALHVPKALLIVLTSVAGAVTAIGAVLVLFNQIPLSFYSYSAARVVIANSWAWALVGIALAVVGMAAQFALDKNYELEEWSMGHEDSHDSHHTTTPGITTPTHA